MESVTPRNRRITDFNEFVGTLDQYPDDFINTFKEQTTPKKLWNDLYFFVIGDPMKEKTNKVRSYIKKELQDNDDKMTKEYK